MALPYADLALLRMHLSAGAEGMASFTAEDVILLQLALDAASAAIDQFTGRSFRAETGTTKYFTASSSDTLDLSPDLRTLTSIAIDSTDDLTFATTLATTDYRLLPLQSYPDSGIYTQVTIAPRSSKAFYVGSQVKVVGDWGYAVDGAAPAAVREACLLQAARFYNRRGAPFGILQSTDLGQFTRISKVDPDVQALLAPYAAGGVTAGLY